MKISKFVCWTGSMVIIARLMLWLSDFSQFEALIYGLVVSIAFDLHFKDEYLWP